jgi:ABC-type transport system involved in Fe-S cluster assembly fused permease/ATPase subunit
MRITLCGDGSRRLALFQAHVDGLMNRLSRRYTFLAGGGQEVYLAAAAQKGRVYILAAQGANVDSETQQGIQRAVKSFRCKEMFRPMY